MKKTIAAAIILIAVFSATVFILSSKMETKWQQPQSDSINLSVSSPVDMVEKEYDQYKYTTDIKNTFFIETFEYKEGMISYIEAVSTAASVAEIAMPFVDVSEIEFEIGLVEEDTFLVCYWNGDTNPDIMLDIHCWINAYTNKIEQITLSRDTSDKSKKLSATVYNVTQQELEKIYSQQAFDIAQGLGYSNFDSNIKYKNNFGCEYYMEAQKGNSKDKIRINFDLWDYLDREYFNINMTVEPHNLY